MVSELTAGSARGLENTTTEVSNKPSAVPVPIDEDRARSFLDLAAATLLDVANVRLPQNRYNLAYDAAHAIGEALLAGHGQCTKNGPGQHEALARFLRIVPDTSSGCRRPSCRPDAPRPQPDALRSQAGQLCRRQQGRSYRSGTLGCRTHGTPIRGTGSQRGPGMTDIPTHASGPVKYTPSP